MHAVLADLITGVLARRRFGTSGPVDRTLLLSERPSVFGWLYLAFRPNCYDRGHHNEFSSDSANERSRLDRILVHFVRKFRRLRLLLGRSGARLLGRAWKEGRSCRRHGGLPHSGGCQWKAEIQHATPDWVLAHSSTYRIKTPVLAQPKYASEIDAVYPDFRDTRFTDEVGSLIRLLAARYDSNPTIAQLRIGTGDMGEDNPRMGPLSAPLPGYTEDMWLQFCRRVTALYLAAFHRRELEFDVGRLSWMYALGSARDKTAVDGFVSYLLRNKVFLEFDGLESSDLARLRTPAPRDGIARSLSYLQMYKQSGGRIGLEAISTELDPKMADINSIIETVKIVEPNRLVFMSVLASAISYNLNGQNPQNSVIGILGSRQREILDKADQLLVRLGYR
jgi:hypothetical protein